VSKYGFYHAIKPGVPCPDGIFAAYVAWSASRGEILPVEWEYNTPPPSFLAVGDEVFVLDLTFGAETLNGWTEKGIKVTLIDHHKPKLELLLPDLSDAVLRHLDQEGVKSGAFLAWEYFLPGKPVPELVEYVSLRDTWQKAAKPDVDVAFIGLGELRKWYYTDDEDLGQKGSPPNVEPELHQRVTQKAQEFAALYSETNIDLPRRYTNLFALFEVLLEMGDRGMDLIRHIGSPLYEKRMAAVRAIAGRAKVMSFSWTTPGNRVFQILDLDAANPLSSATPSTLRVRWILPREKVTGRESACFFIPVVFLEEGEDRLVSDVCEHLYTNRNPDAMFVLAIGGDGKKGSLRSKAGVGANVAQIAIEAGGGGHINAAGFPIQQLLKVGG